MDKIDIDDKRNIWLIEIWVEMRSLTWCTNWFSNFYNTEDDVCLSRMMLGGKGILVPITVDNQTMMIIMICASSVLANI